MRANHNGCSPCWPSKQPPLIFISELLGCGVVECERAVLGLYVHIISLYLERHVMVVQAM